MTDNSSEKLMSTAPMQEETTIVTISTNASSVIIYPVFLITFMAPI